MEEKVIKVLKRFARKDCYYDDEDDNKCVEDYAGGNVDDAFGVGEHAGEVMLARDILTHMGISWAGEE